MSNREWRSHSLRLIALLCSSYALRFAVLAQALQHVRTLRPDALAQLRKMLCQRCIPDGSSNGLGQRGFRRSQIAGRLFPLVQLLIGGGAMPEGHRPLQTVGLDGACRQERDLGVKSIQCLFWLVRNRQQGNAIFVVAHDTRHTLGGGAAFGFIDLRLASRNGVASPACNNSVQLEPGSCAAARPHRRVTLEKNAPALLSGNVNLPLERSRIE
jgi:hypothetical protein